MKDFMTDAQAAYHDRNFKQTLDLYDQEIAQNSNDLLAYEGKGLCLYKLKKPVDSIAVCQQILALDPTFVMAHIIMAEAYHKIKDVSKSRQEIQVAYSMDSTNADVLASYGSLLLLDKKFDDALVFLEKAVNINPNLYSAYNNLAVLYVRKRDRSKVLFLAKEMYRLRRTFKNSVRLTVAYFDYTRLSNIIFILLVLSILIMEIFQIWMGFSIAIGILLLLIVLLLYTRTP